MIFIFCVSLTLRQIKNSCFLDKSFLFGEKKIIFLFRGEIGTPRPRSCKDFGRGVRVGRFLAGAYDVQRRVNVRLRDEPRVTRPDRRVGHPHTVVVPAADVAGHRAGLAVDGERAHAGVGVADAAAPAAQRRGHARHAGLLLDRRELSRQLDHLRLQRCVLRGQCRDLAFGGAEVGAEHGHLGLERGALRGAGFQAQAHGRRRRRVPADAQGGEQLILAHLGVGAGLDGLHQLVGALQLVVVRGRVAPTGEDAQKQAEGGQGREAGEQSGGLHGHLLLRECNVGSGSVPPPRV